MSSWNLNPYGLRNGKIIDVEDLDEETEYGLKCNCKCPRCGEEYVARIRGEKREKHFAHRSGADCGGGYESAIHLFAKEIIEEGITIKLPPVVSSFANNGYLVFKDVVKSPAILSKGYSLDTKEALVFVEKEFESIRPDITVELPKSNLFIEILVTHPVSDEKKEKIRKIGISCLEVDLSCFKDEVITKDDVRKALEGNNKEVFCRWIYNKKVGIIDSDIEEHLSDYLVLDVRDKSVETGTILSSLGQKHDIAPDGKVLKCPDKKWFDGREYYSVMRRCKECWFYRGNLSMIKTECVSGILCSKSNSVETIDVQDVCSWLIERSEKTDTPYSKNGCIERIEFFFEKIDKQFVFHPSVLKAKEDAQNYLIKRWEKEEYRKLYGFLFKELGRLIYYASSAFDDWKAWAYKCISNVTISKYVDSIGEEKVQFVFAKIAKEIWNRHLKDGISQYNNDANFRIIIDDLLENEKKKNENLGDWLYRITAELRTPKGLCYYGESPSARKNPEAISPLPILSKKAQSIFDNL